MRTRRPRTALGILPWVLTLCLTGCHPAKQDPLGEATVAPEHAAAVDEAREVAEASLGKQAQVLAHGNLALNGREQVLAVNAASTGVVVGAGRGALSRIFVTRAAILEKNDGKWSQVLLCDEHLKNPDGYLGGHPADRVTGWRLEYRQDPNEGLEMKFTPAEQFDAVHANVGQSSEPKVLAFEVRWNKSVKRYQTYDQSHERYLSEVPSLETPQSILK